MEYKTVKQINVAIVAGGPECRAILEMFLSQEFERLGLKIIGVVAKDKRSRCHHYACEKGIRTTKDLEGLCRLKALQIIIDLTGNQEVVTEIQRHKSEHVHLIDSVTARLIWSLYQSN